MRSEKVFYVVDAFSIPRLKYNIDRKKFLPATECGVGKQTMFGSAEDKTSVFVDR